MLGIVTVDDVIDAIVREQTEDVQKFGGMEALDEPYMEIGFLRDDRRSARGWLCALFLSEMLTATAMQRFQAEIEKAALLAMFIPLVMSSGGNSGSQATSLIIRALALGEIKLRDWWRIAVRELPTGLALGAILGAIGFCRIGSGRTVRLVRLRAAPRARRAHRRRRADRHRRVRLTRRLDAAVRPAPTGLRPGERIGAVRRHAGGRDRSRDLLQRGVRDSAGNAALIAVSR